jgi:hypothetical protein
MVFLFILPERPSVSLVGDPLVPNGDSGSRRRMFVKRGGTLEPNKHQAGTRAPRPGAVTQNCYQRGLCECFRPDCVFGAFHSAANCVKVFSFVEADQQAFTVVRFGEGKV